ncbi:MAG: hypothetical protein EA340_12705 [Nitriliruptor sp.]|nr:MAG: hypothetical protein EA340_12705 [Nitriliruptor sp.]
MPPFDPGSYPGPRAAGPTLVLNGACWGLALTGDPRRPWLPPRSASPCTARDAPADLRWSLAYGANASPARLVAKGLDRRGAVLLPARITGWAPAFEQRLTTYGAVPVTLVPLPGRVTSTWVLGVNEEDTGLLDASEGRAAATSTGLPVDGHTPTPGTYQLGGIGQAVVAGRFRLPNALAYLPGPATRIQVHERGWRTWPADDQHAARRHLDAGGPWAPAPRVAVPVEGEWPGQQLLALGSRQ